jgi:hypothetical protein
VIVSPKLTKLRLLAERAEREFKAKEAEYLKYRNAMEDAQKAFGAQAEAEGLCPSCLEPDPKGDHYGKCYITIAENNTGAGTT